MIENLAILSGRETIPMDIQDRLLELYQKACNDSYKSKLVDEQYVELVQFKEVNPQNIGRLIEDSLEEGEYKHPCIIDILEQLDSETESEDKGYWSSWFSHIANNKASIFLGRLQGDERDHTYQFMKAPSSKRQKWPSLWIIQTLRAL